MMIILYILAAIGVLALLFGLDRLGGGITDLNRKGKS